MFALPQLNPARQIALKCALVMVLVLISVRSLHAQMPVLGDYYAHDPSRLIKQGNTYYNYRTSQGIMSKYSTDLRNWTYGGQVFPGNPPSWTTNAVPGFTGFFWAPDVVYLNGTYYMYYAVSGFGVQMSGIGLVTTTNLATGPWTDQGPVIVSTNGSAFNAIDPCPLIDTSGAMWMSFGSYWNGIYLIQLDPTTGKRLTPTSTITHLAYNSSIESSFLYQHGSYYYLFVNFDTCCSGIDSTYNIRVGRSLNVTGPYVDRNGTSMLSSGGSMFLESTARFIGPGQVGIMNDNGTNWLTYHYYDGNNAGTATLGLGQLTWGADQWPVFTNDWSALYTFGNDAREHLGLYNGTLQNGASITNDPGLGNALNLDGVSNYALLPNSIANASTFAAWVKWSGGQSWQRIFDFGTSTNKYFFLTPSAANGKLRFAITTSGGAGEQIVEAPTALPSNAWCHVAVTLDGAKGIIYLNANPVATNASVTIRPWRTLSRSNYVGESQYPSDPTFNGEIKSFRTFSRALSPAEIKEVAYAPLSLAHRYNFTNSAKDSIGMAHGTLQGNAVITNQSLVLNGTSGTHVNLPGGLLSGSATVTLEFWATFGVNGNWARVFDFGNIAGNSGQNYLFFSPHTSVGTHRIEVSTNTTSNLDVLGTYDNRTVHVVCIIDPTNHYTAIYTNGVLESSSSLAFPALTSIGNAWSFVGRSLFSSDAWLNATINDLRIYDGRLTPLEIAVNDRFGPSQLAVPVTLVQSNLVNSVRLSWPSYDIGFVPEASDLTGISPTWTTLTNSPSLSNGVWQLIVTKTNAAQFYRLRR